MKRFILIIACAMIASLAMANKPNYRRQLIPNAGILGANADAYITSINLLKDKPFTANGDELIKKYKQTANVVGAAALTYDKIYEQFGEGTARLARDYIRFDLYDQTHSVRIIFRKIRHNVEGKDDLWMIVHTDNTNNL